MKYQPFILTLLLLLPVCARSGNNPRFIVNAGPTWTSNYENKYHLGFGTNALFEPKLSKRFSFSFGLGFYHYQWKEEYDIDTNFHHETRINISSCDCRFYYYEKSESVFLVPIKLKYYIISKPEYQLRLSGGVNAVFLGWAWREYSYYIRDQYDVLHMGPYNGGKKDKGFGLGIQSNIGITFTRFINDRMAILSDFSYMYMNSHGMDRFSIMFGIAFRKDK